MPPLTHTPNIPQVADQDVRDPEFHEVIRKAARQASPLAASITEEKKTSCALPNWEHPDPKTRAALHYARTLTLDHGRDNEVYEELKEYYTNAEVIELAAFFCLTAGGNRMAKSWSIEPHGEVSAIPEGAMSIHGSETRGPETAQP
jgi:alkylhydroperoxidase family enzyme